MIAFALTLVLFLFPLAYSPGPGNMFFAALGARQGLASTMPSNLGYHLATLIVTFLIGLGLVTAIDPGSQLFFGMRVAGALYVLWLAFKMARAGSAVHDAATGRAGFGDGALLLLLNPKAYVIILLMFTQFAGAGPSDGLRRVVLITVVFTLNNFLAFVLWTLAGDGLGRLFRSDTGARALNIGFAAVLAGVAVWMLAG